MGGNEQNTQIRRIKMICCMAKEEEEYYQIEENERKWTKQSFW